MKQNPDPVTGSITENQIALELVEVVGECRKIVSNPGERVTARDNRSVPIMERGMVAGLDNA
jgi:hypothetical protein